MSPDSFSLTGLLWNYAVIFGWVSVVALAMAGYAWKQFQGSLREPLATSTADKSEMWQQTCGFWTTAGVVMAILSILCIVLWRIMQA